MNPVGYELFRLMDGILIGPFRIGGNPVVGFFVGATCLAMGCVVLGEFTLSMAIRFNRRHLDGLSREIAQKEMLSIQAYNVGDRKSYKALNQDANDVWGKHFFTMAAYSAGMLWPVPFCLAWMHSRFHSVTFDLVRPLSWVFGDTVSYAFVFIPLYILCRIVFGHLRPWLPYFRKVQQMLDAAGSG